MAGQESLKAGAKVKKSLRPTHSVLLDQDGANHNKIYDFLASCWRILCSFPKPSVLCFHGSNGKGDKNSLILTVQQRQSIVKSWNVMAADISSIAIKLQLALFLSDAETKRLFWFKNKNGLELLKDQRFRQHAFWMMQAISALVESIDSHNHKEIYKVFFEIGQKHAAVPKCEYKSFRSLSDVYARTWTETLEERYTPHMDNAWRTVFDHMIGILCDGYLAYNNRLRGRSVANALSISVLGSVSDTSFSSQASFQSKEESEFESSFNHSDGSSESSLSPEISSATQTY